MNIVTTCRHLKWNSPYELHISSFKFRHIFNCDLKAVPRTAYKTTRYSKQEISDVTKHNDTNCSLQLLLKS